VNKNTNDFKYTRKKEEEKIICKDLPFGSVVDSLLCEFETQEREKIGSQ
jgi:hypothetical protein